MPGEEGPQEPLSKVATSSVPLWAMPAVVISFVLVFVLDVMTTVGIATGMLFTVPVALSIATNRQRVPLAVAAVASVLVPVALFLKPTGYSDVSIPNRSMMMVAIWVTALLSEYQLQTQGKMQVSYLAVRHALSGVAFVGLDGKVKRVNASFTKLSGLARDADLKALSIEDIAVDKKQMKDIFATAVKEGR